MTHATESMVTQAERCNRCGHTNAIWRAASPLWNAVMRGGCIDGEAEFADLVCAGCFMELAERKGVASHFRVTADEVNVSLQTVTPSGRVWDEASWLWSNDSRHRTAAQPEREAVPVDGLLRWIEDCWPAGTGSDFNQGVVRGFEIIRAQLEAGHIQKYCAAHATALTTPAPAVSRDEIVAVLERLDCALEMDAPTASDAEWSELLTQALNAREILRREA